MVAGAIDATVHRCKPSLPGPVSKYSAEAVGTGGREGGALRGKEQGRSKVYLIHIKSFKCFITDILFCVQGISLIPKQLLGATVLVHHYIESFATIWSLEEVNSKQAAEIADLQKAMRSKEESHQATNTELRESLTDSEEKCKKLQTKLAAQEVAMAALRQKLHVWGTAMLAETHVF